MSDAEEEREGRGDPGTHKEGGLVEGTTQGQHTPEAEIKAEDGAGNERRRHARRRSRKRMDTQGKGRTWREVGLRKGLSWWAKGMVR